MDGRDPILTPQAPSREATPASPQVADSDKVRAALERVLSSQEFRSSKRCQDFLKYVVDSTLNGQGETLKERTIAMDVFGRGSEYDPGDSATVRVRAGEVRKRLERYYNNEGLNDEIRIGIRAGSYVPEFLPRTEIAPASEIIEELAPASPAGKHFLSSLRIRLLLLLLVFATAAGLIWYKNRPRPTVIDEFWAPLTNTSSPVLLFASSVPVYSLNHDPRVKATARADEFILVNDQYMGVSDVNGIYRISALLSGMHRPYRVRIGKEISFSELPGEPAVLVGYTYTHWKEISSGLRYFIHVDGPPFGILDRNVSTPWVLSTLPNDPKLSEDYAVVSRIFHPDTNAMLVELAGISHFGTEAAADLVSNPDMLRDALKGAPPDWRNKNIQIIIHVKIIDGAPSAPQVVASYFW